MTTHRTPETVMGIDLARGDDISTYTIAEKHGDIIKIVEAGHLQRRVVRSAQRKRKLRRRGESIGWNVELGAWVWYMRRAFV